MQGGIVCFMKQRKRMSNREILEVIFRSLKGYYHNISRYIQYQTDELLQKGYMMRDEVDRTM